MSYQPRDYQHAMTGALLAHPRFNLWAGMGTGKTVATLTAIDTLLALGEVNQVLVVAPLRVASSTWPDELAKWDHLTDIRMQVVVGTPAQRMAALAAEGNVHVINYENIPWLVEVLGKGHWPFDMVVADEATKLKSFRLNGGGSRVKALAKAANGKTVRWVNLTGTPASNGLIDLWGQQWFVDKGEALGRSFGMFRDRWFTTGYDGYSVKLTPYGEREITERMKPSSLTIEAGDYLDLPDLVSNIIGVVLTPTAMKQYKAMEQEMFVELDGEEVEAFNAASKTIKCLQMASGALYIEEGYSVLHDAKLDALEDVVEEANGEPVLVAYHFKSDLDRLKKRFKSAVVLDKDPETIRRWNRGEIPILLAHPASAGHGLNLQDGGRILVFFSHWWSLEEYSQIIERIGPTRQLQAGHPRTVYVHHLVAKGTLDEAVIAARDGKVSVQKALMDYQKQKR